MIQASELVSSDALRRYDDNGDPIYSTHEQVLLTLRWFGWVTAERVCEALGLDLNAPLLYPERSRYSKALHYWVKRGRVEQRHDFDVVEYKLIHPSQWPVEQTCCSRCSAAVVAGKTMCQRHLDWERDYKRRSRESTPSLRVA